MFVINGEWLAPVTLTTKNCIAQTIIHLYTTQIIFFDIFFYFFAQIAYYKHKLGNSIVNQRVYRVIAAELAKHVFLVRAETGATDLLDNSFPSGHATVAAAAAFAVFLVSPPRWRPLAAVCGGAVAVLTGVLLVIDQWHRPSDVVAAFMLVAACGCLGGIALLLWSVPRADPPARTMPALWWIAGASAVVSAVAFVIIFITVENHGSHLQIAYAGGGTGILAIGSAFAAAGNTLFRRIS